jgi:drug/metabolite transporter (DMT)-like permease
VAVYPLGLFSALAFALGLVLQQRGTLQTAAPEGDPHFLQQILRKRVWLLGCLLLVCGWGFQAAALHFGSLAVVQSLQALSLVLALPLGMRLTRQRVGRRSLIGACTTLVGIVLLVTLGQPQGGVDRPAGSAWWIAGVVIGSLVVALVLVASTRRGSFPAALFAAAAGIAFALEAAITKTLVMRLDVGLGTIFLNWPIYVFIISGFGGFILQQAALKTGCLAPATAALNAATLVVSIVLGLTIFQESISGSYGRLTPALIGLAMAIAGVVTLALPGPAESCALP